MLACIIYGMDAGCCQVLIYGEKPQTFSSKNLNHLKLSDLIFALQAEAVINSSELQVHHQQVRHF